MRQVNPGPSILNCVEVQSTTPGHFVYPVKTEWVVNERDPVEESGLDEQQIFAVEAHAIGAHIGQTSLFREILSVVQAHHAHSPDSLLQVVVQKGAAGVEPGCA